MDEDRRLSNANNAPPAWNRLPTVVIAGAAALPAVWLLVFYAWPVVTLLARGLRPAAIADSLADDRTWRVLWFTTWQATLSTALTLVAGLAPAWALARFEFRGRRMLMGALTAVFVMPTVVIGAAFIALLPASLERSLWAILAAHVAFNLAVVVRTVGAVWAQLPDDLGHAAATLGATPAATLRWVVLPLLRPALGAAATIVFAFTFTSFGVVRLLGGARRATIEVEVWRRATQLGELGTAATLSVLQLVVLGAVAAWSARWQRARAVAGGVTHRPRRRPVGSQRRSVGAIASLTALAVALPLGALVERSLRSGSGYSWDAWRAVLGGTAPGAGGAAALRDAVVRSLTTAGWATLAALVVGGAAVVAIDLARRTGRLLDVGLMLPLATSAVTIGFGMLITFDTPPVDWRAAWWLVPVGQALIAVPFVVRTGLAALRGAPPELRDAAATLGAAPWRAWATATLPLLRRPLVNAAGLAFAVSLGEFGATSLLSRSGGDTMPIAIARLLGRTGEVFHAQAFAMATLLALTTIVVVTVLDATGADGSGRARR